MRSIIPGTMVAWCAIEAVRDLGHAIGHRAGEAVFLDDGPILRIEKLDGRKSDPFRPHDQVL
jgi:hypothetical protein